jgi:hypothetical protein
MNVIAFGLMINGMSVSIAICEMKINARVKKTTSI